MIIVNLQGGLGNQMFQYAYGRYLAHRYGLPIYLNTMAYEGVHANRHYNLDIFRLCQDQVTDITEVQRLCAVKEVVMLKEEGFSFNEFAMHPIDTGEDPAKMILVIDGYWQSYKYFLPVADTIRRDFRFADPLVGKWLALFQKISATNAVMVHVRRGDYLQQQQFHGVLGTSYIVEAMKQMQANMPDAFFFIFSDGIDWCRENIEKADNIFFVDDSYADPGSRLYFQLMCSCRHFILANSSFSWWSAWLAPGEQRSVIAPVNWFADPGIDTGDLLPPGWVRL